MTKSPANPIYRIESLITRPAESLTDPQERQAEFARRLERTRQLLRYLDEPQLKVPSIHIGGTSGKGSVAMFCESILREHGLRIGSHISPYLQTPLEKVRVDGKMISPEAVAPLVETVMDAVERVKQEQVDLGAPQFAEAWFALAMTYFVQQKCDVAVVEVGMGGRYDSTNVLDPLVSVVNTVHYDHMRVLGETLEEIAFHKAGIIKPETPVVLGPMPDSAGKVMEETIKEMNAVPFIVGEDFRYEQKHIGPEGATFAYSGVDHHFENLGISLPGEHQLKNATTALGAVEICARALHLHLEPDLVRRGLENTRFAGRMEIMPGKPTVILDGAHNVEKISALVQSLRVLYPGRQITLIFALLKTKSAGRILRLFKDITDTIITTETKIKGKPAISAEELGEFAQHEGFTRVIAEPDPIRALETGRSQTDSDGLIVITGSLFLVGALRPHWHPTEAVEAQQTMFTKVQVADG